MNFSFINTFSTESFTLFENLGEGGGEGGLSTREPFSYDYGTGLHLNSKRLRCNLKMELRLKKFFRTLF